MKAKYKRVQFFLVITISFFFSVVSAYSNYCGLMEADLVSPYWSFENPDQDIQSVANQDKIKVFGVGASSGILRPITSLFEESSYFFSQPRSLNLKTIILRC